MSTFARCFRLACVLVVVGLLGHATAVHAETLESVQKSIADSWSKIKSATYDAEMASNNEGQGYSMKMTANSKSEVLRSGETTLMRTETKMSNDMTAGGNTTKTEMSSTMVVDGEFAYTLSDNAGQKSVMKMKGKQYSEGAGGQGLFKMLGETYTLALLPDETVDGKGTYVIEGKPKDANAPGGSVSKYYFAKDTGMVVQSITTSADGKSKTTMKIVNLKLNPDIPADHFKFTPPAGVQITDMSK